MKEKKIFPKKRTALNAARIIALGFMGIIVVGAVILYLPFSNKAHVSFIDCLYMSVSAVCLVGLSTVPLATSFTFFGQIVFLILIQAGGLGFMTITSLFFLIIKKKFTFKERLLLQEALNQNQNKGVVKLAKNVSIFTLLCELAGCVILVPAFCVKNGIKGLWQAVFTSVSAFCNAGFDVFATADNPYPSFTQYSDSPLILLTIAALVILGGLGFAVVGGLTDKITRKRKFSVHVKVVLTMTCILLTLGTVFILGAEYNGKALEGMNFGEKLLNSFFQSVTARTAGFASFDQADMSAPSKLMTMLFMFIGGAPASTAGGIKITTVALLIGIMVAGIKGSEDVVLFKRTIDRKTCFKAVSCMLIAMLIIVIVSALVLLIEANAQTAEMGFTMEDIMFETFSAFGTTGLSTGITPYITDYSKILFIATMFFGRIGTITVGLIFYSHTNNLPYRYPQDNLMIG